MSVLNSFAGMENWQSNERHSQNNTSRKGNQHRKSAQQPYCSLQLMGKILTITTWYLLSVAGGTANTT